MTKIVTEALAQCQWDAATLAARRNGDARKVLIAQRLQRETTLTLAWIATRLAVGNQILPALHCTHCADF